MATSEVSICKLALSHIGDEATVTSINPPEGSPQAEHCQTFYPLARDALLQMHPWNFATRRVTSPAALTSETTVWTYCYALPAGTNLLDVISVLPANSTNDYSLVSQSYSDATSSEYLSDITPYMGGGFVTAPFATEALEDGTIVIYTDVYSPEIRYTVRVTDTVKFPPLFVTALARLLASYLTGPVIKGDAGVKMGAAQYQIFLTVMGQASAKDANQQQASVRHIAPWMANR